MAASGGDSGNSSDSVEECEMPCNNCDDPTKSPCAKRGITLYCYVCGIYCCDSCGHSCRNHKVLRVTKESQICPVHSNQIMCYYCSSRKELLCPVEEKSKHHRSVFSFPHFVYFFLFHVVVLPYVMYSKLLKEYVSNITFLSRVLELINNTNLADVSSDKLQKYRAKSVHKVLMLCKTHSDVSQRVEI